MHTSTATVFNATVPPPILSPPSSHEEEDDNSSTDTSAEEDEPGSLENYSISNSTFKIIIKSKCNYSI
jgi:hypothetical protein